jgi:hypothetical protein
MCSENKLHIRFNINLLPVWGICGLQCLIGLFIFKFLWVQQHWRCVIKTCASGMMHYERIEDTKGVIKSHQYNDQMKKYKMTNNDLQNITLKTKNRTT